jgi:nitrogen fixation protein
MSAWIGYNYLEEPILKVASIPLSWGVILLILYVSFKKLNWDWWS